jgi:hypothetical protein
LFRATRPIPDLSILHAKQKTALKVNLRCLTTAGVQIKLSLKVIFFSAYFESGTRRGFHEIPKTFD